MIYASSFSGRIFYTLKFENFSLLGYNIYRIKERPQQQYTFVVYYKHALFYAGLAFQIERRMYYELCRSYGK